MSSKELKERIKWLESNKKWFDDEYNKKIDALQSQLTEAEKLEHGDYHLSESGNCLWAKDNDGTLRPITDTHICHLLTKGIAYNNEPILGNIFDDLAALKPKEEFELHGTKISFEKWGVEQIAGDLIIPRLRVKQDEIPTFITNLRCLELYLKQKGEKA